MREKYERSKIIIILTLLVWSGCKTVNSDFKIAQESNTLQAYQDFLEKHPTDPLAEQVRVKLQARRAEVLREVHSLAIKTMYSVGFSETLILFRAGRALSTIPAPTISEAVRDTLHRHQINVIDDPSKADATLFCDCRRTISWGGSRVQESSKGIETSENYSNIRVQCSARLTTLAGEIPWEKTVEGSATAQMSQTNDLSRAVWVASGRFRPDRQDVGYTFSDKDIAEADGQLISRLTNELSELFSEKGQDISLSKESPTSKNEKPQQKKSPLNREGVVYKPDGTIILIDEPDGTVHLNIGTEDNVFRGLIFSVYDRNDPIPEHGNGKAGIEVFNVNKRSSQARIIRSDRENPIAAGDIVVNLIWDRDRTNVFALAGEFALDTDGTVGRNTLTKLRALIEKWGGTAVDEVSARTDLLVLGNRPQVPAKPTYEDLQADPTAGEKYNSALASLHHYNESQSRAKALGIPILEHERFLRFIGFQ